MSGKARGQVARITIKMKKISNKEVPVLVRPCVLYTMEGTMAAQVILYVQLLLCAVDVNGIKETLKDVEMLDDVVDAVDFLREQWYLCVVDLETAGQVCKHLLPENKEVLECIEEARTAQQGNKAKSETTKGKVAESEGEDEGDGEMADGGL